MDFDFFKVLIIGYVLGSIPSGFIVSKLKKIDIRTKGSGNIGFTNVLRVIGPVPASFVLFFDAFKGWFSAYYGYQVGYEKLALVGAIGALIGNLFPLFLNFKGGKGVATGFGICLFIMPKITLITLFIFLIVVFTSKYMSLGSLSAATVVLVLSYLSEIHHYYKIFAVVAVGLVFVMHRSNIKRLINGNENKIL